MSVNLEIQSRLTCPNCWADLSPADLLWISSHPDLRGDNYLGTDAQKRFLPSRFDSDGFALDANGMRSQSLACPECHLTIPRILVDFKPIFVSVIGASSSGKSYFLTSAVWELRRKCQALHLSFADADPVANQIISEHEQKLFLNDKPNELVAILRTETDGELYQQVNYGTRQELYARPFVFSLKPNADHIGYKGEKELRLASRALCLYDNAGEHFRPNLEAALSPATNHLALSEALIYVFDPLQHPKFRQLCRKHSQDPQLNDDFQVVRQDEVIIEAAKRIRLKANLAEHEHFKKPLVVAVNKLDVWQHLLPDIDFSNLHPYQATGNGVTGIYANMINEASRVLRELLVKAAPEVVAACDSFCNDVTYIPISPQGCSPEVKDGNWGVRPASLKPVWAEVPLLYAISRTNCGLVPTLSSNHK